MSGILNGVTLVLAIPAAAAALLGVAPQALAVYDLLTGEENLRFFGQVYGLSGAALDERVKWCLDFVGLTDRKGDRAGGYSGGMKRRLNLAAAMLHDPELLLLDEPTVGVDPQSRNKIFESISALHRHGRTVIYTTHYMEEAERLCDRVAIVDKGRLLALDTVDNLIRQHGGASQIVAHVDRWPEGLAHHGSLVGDQLQITIDRPIDEVSRLAAAGATFQSLEIHGPSLEGVFLTLTGRSLRD